MFTCDSWDQTFHISVINLSPSNFNPATLSEETQLSSRCPNGVKHSLTDAERTQNVCVKHREDQTKLIVFFTPPPNQQCQSSFESSNPESLETCQGDLLSCIEKATDKEGVASQRGLLFPLCGCGG